uniref:Uncharacterized protein n=1 Tax=Sinocyclocheilus grahami TaxID=75366 RepID=A0A672JS98_SINGR
MNNSYYYPYLHIYFPGSQATVATRSVAVGNTTSRLVPLCSSTPLKRKAVSPYRPQKCSLLEILICNKSFFVVFFVNRAPTKIQQDMVKYLVDEECLLDLFKICSTCSRVCKVVTFVKVTFLSVTQKCLQQCCSYNRQWKSQPLLGSYPAGNLHLSAAFYYTYSSFIQTNKVFNWRFHSYVLPARLTQVCHLPGCLHLWSNRKRQRKCGKQSKTVSLGGDMRADSPGHCVKYGSYSMMDLSTNTIVDIQLVQSNEVGSSVRMANEGLIQSLEFLERSGVKKPDIDHFYVWHLSLTKKVDAISKEKGCNKIKMWKEGIKASTEETVAKWISLLNHIQNVHVHENPLFPKCLHPPSADKNKWVKPGTPLFNRNYVILLESCNIQYSQLLCTHHILSTQVERWAVWPWCNYVGVIPNKSLSFRLYLAAYHFNENSGRTQARTGCSSKLNFQRPREGNMLSP